MSNWLYDGWKRAEAAVKNVSKKLYNVAGPVIEGFLDWIGLGGVVKDATRKGQQLDTETLQNLIEDRVSELLTRADTDIDELERRLNSVPSLYPNSVKAQINEAKAKLNKEIKDKQFRRGIAGAKIDQARQYITMAQNTKMGEEAKARDYRDKAQTLMSEAETTVKGEFK